MSERSTTTGSERRHAVAGLVRYGLGACAALVVLTLGGICAILGLNAWRAFSTVSSALTEAERAMFTPEELAELEASTAAAPDVVADFLGTALWIPAAAPPEYGIGAMVVSTLLVTACAMAIATPVGLAAAAWLAYRARGRPRQAIKFAVEMLAAIPSVVLGFIGIILLGPLISRFFDVPSGLTALNGGVLLALMALPTIVSIGEDAFSSVPPRILRGSLALGADGWQTLLRAAVPAARSGLFAAVLLGMGRAIGETMTVLMATGNVVAMPGSLLDPVRTMTATIAIELGEVPAGSTHYLMLFAVGLVLFLITLLVNLAADWVQRRGEVI